MTVRTGVVGTGWVTEKHIDALQKIPDATVAAIAGRNLTRARELAARVKGNAYENYLQMLQKEKLDAVIICMPPHVHGDLEVACSEYASAALIEKPVANNLETARRAEAAFDRAGTLTAAGYMSRYRSSVERIRALYSSSIDPIVLVNGWWVTQMPPPAWWRTMDQSGGQFVEQCTHLADIARWLVGEIIEVSAFTARGFITEWPDYSVDDATVVNAKFASGAIGNFTTACHPRGAFSAASGIGMAFSSRTLQCFLSGWGMDGTIGRADGSFDSIPASNEDIFAIQDGFFIKAVAEKNPSLIRSTYSDAIQTLAAGLAANESARNGGRPVAIAQPAN